MKNSFYKTQRTMYLMYYIEHTVNDDHSYEKKRMLNTPCIFNEIFSFNYYYELIEQYEDL